MREANWRDKHEMKIGVYIAAGGEKYEGRYMFNQRHGSGELVCANGDKYEGEFRSHRYCGHGTLIYTGGTKYVGEWLNNQYHGQGTLTIRDSLIDNFNSGDVYRGDWVDGLRHGIGMYRTATEYIYDGSWSNDMPSDVATHLFVEISDLNDDERDSSDFSLDVGEPVPIDGGDLVPSLHVHCVHHVEIEPPQDEEEAKPQDKAVEPIEGNDPTQELSTTIGRLCTKESGRRIRVEMKRGEDETPTQFYIVDPEYEPPEIPEGSSDSDAFEGYKLVPHLTVTTTKGSVSLEGLRFPSDLEPGVTYVLSFVDTTCGVPQIESYAQKFVVKS